VNVRTVLVVEDEWAIADWLQALLADEGYSVLVAGNGKRALEFIAAQKPDLILTDFMMPIMDGPAMLSALKRDGVADIPVIVMSSLPEATVKERCDGYHAFIRKPFRESELLQAIQRLLDGEAR
jgi:two-component system chemotaxis sensor kinase CheA